MNIANLLLLIAAILFGVASVISFMRRAEVDGIVDAGLALGALALYMLL
jgi:hypothetical protein